jgi:hypothetical protein
MAKNKASLASLTLNKGASSPMALGDPTAIESESSSKRKGQTLRLEEGAWKQLKHLATDKGVSAHDLLIEAVNDLFRKYGKPPIA